MAITFDAKKGAEKLSGIIQKTTEVSKNAAESVQKGTAAFSEKLKEDGYQRRLKKYNPLFLEEYLSVEFAMPQLIVIVDDSARNGIDVCEGAIGWQSVEADTKVLHLHNTSIALRDLEFYPAVTVNATYYVDTFNPRRYINVDCIFSKAHEERLAELKQIAYALGAKSCTIEITECSQEANATNSSGMLGAMGKINLSIGQASSNTNAKKCSGKITAIFEGSTTPTQPKLKWFANDENIKNLINIRCAEPGRLKYEELRLSGSSSATMTQAVAAAIDGIKSLKGNASMQSQAMVEHSSEMLFVVEF